MTDERAGLVEQAAKSVGAVEDDRIPGLWHAPGYPELTTGQLIQVATLRREALG